MSKKPSVAIVGGGPSSVFALLACRDSGISPMIVNRAISVQPGAFWFHKLPESEAQFHKPVKIHVGFVGTRESYVSKQWRDYDIPSDYKSSFPQLEEDMMGYNPVDVMERVFKETKHGHWKITKDYTDFDLLRLVESGAYDLVFHSFPTERARFENGDVMVKIPVAVTKFHDPDHEPLVIYDGRPDVNTVRTSWLWGYKFQELRPIRHVDPATPNGSDLGVVLLTDLVPFNRPVESYPLSSRIVPIGRLARFDRKSLSHDTYDVVRGYIENF